MLIGLGFKPLSAAVVCLVANTPPVPFGPVGVPTSMLCQELLRRCGVKPSDVVVSITQNADEDWSFGYGRAQFITGEL
jgi:L-lactate permease